MNEKHLINEKPSKKQKILKMELDFLNSTSYKKYVNPIICLKTSKQPKIVPLYIKFNFYRNSVTKL